MRLISHVIFLLFLGPLHGLRCLIVAILQSPAKGNKRCYAGGKFVIPQLRPCKTQWVQHLYTAPWSVSATKTQWFSLFRVSGSADTLWSSWKKPTLHCLKNLLSSFLCNSHCCHIHSWQSVYTIRVKCFVFQEGDGGRDERATHVTCFVFAHMLI